MKGSLIFAKLLELITPSTLSSTLFEFLRYLYPFQRYSKFQFSGFFNSAYLITFYYKNYSVYSTFYAEFRSVKIFKLSLTVYKISLKAFIFFLTVRDHSARLFLLIFDFFMFKMLWKRLY